MRRIRVLVVDDAVVVRKILSDILAADPDIEVVGTAASGTIALQKLPQLTPDVVTLDVEMPGLTGIETVREIRKRYPMLPVIMFSTLTERGAAATIDALAAGATDYVTKPANVGSVAAGMQAVRESIIPRIKSLCGRACGIEPSGVTSRPERPAAPRLPRPATSRIDVLAIGTSTGGPNALNAVLPHLPADLPVPVVIVQHMPAVFTKLLADRLSARCPFPVVEATHGELISPGRVWIAPGDHHMLVKQSGTSVRIELNQDPPENSCRPAVDPLFRSVARVYGDRTLAVVLTGMGYDGRRGAEAVHEAGGRILAQDQATSVVWGMPGAVADAGIADALVPLDQMAPEIGRHIRAQRPALVAAQARRA